MKFEEKTEETIECLEQRVQQILKEKKEINRQCQENDLSPYDKELLDDLREVQKETDSLKSYHANLLEAYWSIILPGHSESFENEQIWQILQDKRAEIVFDHHEELRRLKEEYSYYEKKANKSRVQLDKVSSNTFIGTVMKKRTALVVLAVGLPFGLGFTIGCSSILDGFIAGVFLGGMCGFYDAATRETSLGSSIVSCNQKASIALNKAIDLIEDSHEIRRTLLSILRKLECEIEANEEDIKPLLKQLGLPDDFDIVKNEKDQEKRYIRGTELEKECIEVQEKIRDLEQLQSAAGTSDSIDPALFTNDKEGRQMSKGGKRNAK